MRRTPVGQVALSLALLSAPAHAIGTAFLNVPFTPRQFALGGAGTALPGDPSLFRLNPALVVQAIPATQVFLGYNAWLADAQGHSVVTAHPFFGGTLGLGLRSLTISDLELRTQKPTDDPLALFATSGTAVEAAWGTGSETVRWGGTIRWLHMESYIYASSGVAIDVGGLVSLLDGRLTAGAALRNSGQMEVFKETAPSLPTTASIGVTFTPFREGAPFSPLAAATVDLSESVGTVLRVGGEFGVGDVTVAAGTRLGREVSAYSGGVTFRARTISIAYGFEVASHNLGMPHLLQIQLTLP